jgi:hypothetical protein
MAEILLAIETSRSRAPQLNNEHLLNWMTERQPAEAKGQAPLFGCAGLTFFSSTGQPGSPSRGSLLFQTSALFVQGDQLFEVRADGNAFVLGEGIAGTGPVGMASNGLQAIIVNGNKGWTFDFVNGFEQITSPAFSPAATVTYMDGYFLFDHLNTNQWFISALFDGRTYSGLDFASAEGAPGNVIAVQQNLQLVFIFCTDHIEIWYDSGAASFPFARYTGGIINYGTISPFSIVKTDGALFFLGVDHVFYRLQANVPIRISTHPIERFIAAEPDIALAECFTLTIEGHKLIFLTLPHQAVTLCYDISTGRWHERDSVDANFISLGRYRVRNALDAYDTTLVGDAFDGRIGQVDWDFFKEYSLPMRGLIDTVTQHADRNYLFCHRFELDIEAGVGLTTGDGSDPKIMLRRTTDGGKTFSAQQPWRSMGKQGEFAKRLRWLRQGRGRQMGWRLEITDPVRRAIIAAHADIEPGFS